jgi:hypothetical protein
MPIILNLPQELERYLVQKSNRQQLSIEGVGFPLEELEIVALKVSIDYDSIELVTLFPKSHQDDRRTDRT